MRIMKWNWKHLQRFWIFVEMISNFWEKNKKKGQFELTKQSQTEETIKISYGVIHTIDIPNPH